MGTQKEIVERVKEKQKQLFNFESEVLVPYLSFKSAKPFLTEEATEEKWEKHRSKLTKTEILKDAKIYMKEIGWPKCQDHRGISASRTLMKMQAWVWLLGDDKVLRKIERMVDNNYAQYGAPVLDFICNHYGWPIPKDESLQRMIQGDRCGAEYNCGCS
jgi:hypothetical protein